MPLRDSNIGGPIVMGLTGAIVRIIGPSSYEGLRVDVLAWSLIGWAIVWLLGEVIANGTAKAQMTGNLMFREANMGAPSMLGALGTVMLWANIEAMIPAVPFEKIGLVLVIGAVIWLIGEAIANGVTRSRSAGRRREDETHPPVIIG